MTIKTFEQFLSESISRDDKEWLADAVAEDASPNDDIEEMVGMFAEDIGGFEHITARDIKQIADMVRKKLRR